MEPTELLYLDCQAGIAGDMFVAALLDIAGPAGEAAVRAMLQSLPVDGFEVEVARTSKSGIDCCDFSVRLDAAHDGRDHDMAYLHGEGANSGFVGDEYDCDHAHGDEGHHHAHAHEVCEPGHNDHDHNDHDHNDHDHSHVHPHEHRGLAEIEAIIAAARMTDAAKAFARKTFRILAEAEARAHAVAVEAVHFHEVGAVDSIVDVLSAGVLVDYLGVSAVSLPALVDGQGSIRCQHGVIPVPVPATLNICIAHGLPLSQSAVQGELVTPTGAAIAAALEPQTNLPGRYVVKAAGYGAGKRAYERPSILRAFVIEPLSGEAREKASVSETAKTPAELSREICPPGTTTKLECEIDDCSPEVLAYAADCLREAGAREVHWVPVFSKKGRPAWQLQVICANGDVDRMQQIVFAETTTLGIRRQQMERTFLPRSLAKVETEWGPVQIKTATLPDSSKRVTPEYEDCAAIARTHGIPLQLVMKRVLELASA